VSAFKALMLAASAYMRVLPLIHLRRLYNDKDFFEDEIFKLASSGTAADELRMEVLAKRAGRVDKQIRHILACVDSEKG